MVGSASKNIEHLIQKGACVYMAAGVSTASMLVYLLILGFLHICVGGSITDSVRFDRNNSPSSQKTEITMEPDRPSL